MKRDYSEVYGIWTVTTEGDCEGRTTTQLGTYEGFVDEIAFRLADKAYYSLYFTLADKLPDLPKSEMTSVHINFNIDSGTWPLTGKQRMDWGKKFFSTRPVVVEESNYYACMLLSMPEFNAKQLKKQAALDKLTKEERELLGV